MLRPLALILALLGSPVMAQQVVEFGGLAQDPTQPVSVDADSLSVNQADGSATFNGNVRVAQGEMRLGAQAIRVIYGEEEGEIRSLDATGGVTLANGQIAAEAQTATYTIASGKVEMTGDVLLTQGQSTIAGQKLIIDLQAGTGTMEGRVQTLFRPEQKQ